MGGLGRFLSQQCTSALCFIANGRLVSALWVFVHKSAIKGLFLHPADAEQHLSVNTLNKEDMPGEILC